MNRCRFGLFVFVLFPLAACADLTITGTCTYADAKLGLTVVGGTLDLPGGEGWTVLAPASDSPLAQPQLVLPQSETEDLRGVRTRKAELARQTEQERYPLWTLFDACSQYARTNGGVGPGAWIDITTNKVRHLSPNFVSLTTNFGLVPAVPIRLGSGTPPERRALALQLHPFVADGKHWVLYNDGQSLRVPIDRALCATNGFVIQPRLAPGAENAEPPAPPSQRFAVLALVKSGMALGAVRLTFTNRLTGASADANWSLAQAAHGDRSVLTAWARARSARWARMAAGGDAPVLRYWMSRWGAVYGDGASGFADGMDRGRGEVADAFSVLGGRAAVRETLQMQPLRQNGAPGVTSTVAVATIAGVDVKSHPFDEMLKGVTPGNLSLAESVPADRAFVYFPKPDALLPLLEGGADFIFQSGSLAVGNTAAYDLKSRYVDRLALTDQWVRDLLLKSGAVKEMGLIAPDLFFVDGTEVTVLARVPAARVLRPALIALGLGDLGDGVQARTGTAGTSFWAMDGDLLLIGTSRSEVDRVLALRKAGGVGSLGQSAEFRYMLAQMPLRPETRLYGYLSDPFIRRLVGPEVKIGQLRRLVAKGEMEGVSAAALLYQLDGQPGRPGMAALIAKGYLAGKPAIAADCALDDRLVASCPAYGSPARLKTLLETPVTAATPAEVAAYRAYVDNYSRFWRRYFDPMAFRLDDGPQGELQLTTFILPLVDNTIYNGLKDVLRHKEDATPLRLPDLDPKPLLMLSANLSEDTWTKITRDLFSDLLRRYTSLDPAAFDKIGPGIHLAVHDADPILTFGAGDALGILGAPLMTEGRNSEMLFVPLVASILTRPCQLIVELQDPEAVRRMLLAAATTPAGAERRWESVASFYKVDGRDAWVCTIAIENIVRVRFGVEVRDKYLILSNLPWSQKPAFGVSRNAELNALALDLHPEAGLLQMPGLFTAACEQERAAAVQGERYLYPFFVTGAASAAAATEQCRVMFGFAPEHPGKGQWVWENGEVRSTVYGTATHPVQPEYRAGDCTFGALGGLDALKLNLQFEDAGLRAIMCWKLK